MVEQFFQQFRAKGLKEEKSVKKYQQKIEGRVGEKALWWMPVYNLSLANIRDNITHHLSWECVSSKMKFQSGVWRNLQKRCPSQKGLNLLSVSWKCHEAAIKDKNEKPEERKVKNVHQIRIWIYNKRCTKHNLGKQGK